MIAIYYGVRARRCDDTLGWAALYLMALWRVAAYGHSFAIWLIPWVAGGTPRAINGVFSWAVILLIILLGSGWREPEDSFTSSEEQR